MWSLRGLTNTSTTSYKESLPEFTGRLSNRARASELELETRAKLNDARFASARVLPEVGIRGAIAIASGDTARNRAGGGAAKVEVHGRELSVVQSIECLKAQLEIHPFADPCVLGENQVQVVYLIAQPELVKASRSATEIPCQD